MVQLAFTMLTLGVVSGLSLLLGAIGLYGVLSYVVAERTREIGVRVALGAERRDVLWLVIREAAIVVAIGAALGVPLAILAGRGVASQLYGVRPVDPASYAAAAVVLTAIAGFAAFLPAHRASRIDPMAALRKE